MEVPPASAEAGLEPEFTVGEGADLPSTIGQELPLNLTELPQPLPFLDVLSFHSRRLLPVTRKEVEAQEREWQRRNAHKPHRKAQTDAGHGHAETLTPEEEAKRLDELLASVHLLLEPIQLPDLSHTGVFDPATSLLRPTVHPPVAAAASGSVMKRSAAGESSTSTKLTLTLSKPDKADEVKLFYPSGAKNANMRDYIRETIQRHFSSLELAESPAEAQAEPTLGASASAPTFRPQTPGSRTRASVEKAVVGASPSKFRASVRAARKKSKLRAAKSPVKMSLAPSASLNRELTRQAKDVIAAVRANSSKINELISQ